MGEHIGAQHRIHATQMPFASGLKPLKHIVIDAQRNGLLGRTSWHDQTRGFEKGPVHFCEVRRVDLRFRQRFSLG